MAPRLGDSHEVLRNRTRDIRAEMSDLDLGVRGRAWRKSPKLELFSTISFASITVVQCFIFTLSLKQPCKINIIIFIFPMIKLRLREIK